MMLKTESLNNLEDFTKVIILQGYCMFLFLLTGEQQFNEYLDGATAYVLHVI